ERGVGGIERCRPLLVPRKEAPVLAEALGQVLKRKPLRHRGVREGRLSDELRRWGVERLLLPMHGDLGLTEGRWLSSRLGFRSRARHFRAPGRVTVGRY